MVLHIQELANQLLELTRVVSSGPVLEPGEPLRVDVVPPGAGSEVTGVLGGLDFPLDYNVLRLSVTYQIFREGEIGEPDVLLVEGGGTNPQDYLRVPATSVPPPVADLLSVAFLVKPQIKFQQKPPQLDLPPVTLPKFNHRLEVTISIGTTNEDPAVPGTFILESIVTKKIVVKFLIPPVVIPLPVVPAVCICSRHANLALTQEGEAGQFVVMIAPGGPSTLSEVIAIYNQVIDTVLSLAGVLDLASVMLSPLQKVANLLESIPSPFVSNESWIADFDDFDDFDDTMSSFLLVAPAGIGVQFSDEANPTDWDASSDIGLKEYQPIDLLQLVGTADEESAPEASKSSFQRSREYVRSKLGLNPTAITDLRTTIGDLLGVQNVDGLTLGLGVMYIANLSEVPSENADAEKIDHLLKYDNEDNEYLQDDVASARWLPPYLGQ